MSYQERKQAEVQRKMDALAEEFQRWLAATEAGAAFPKHHSQVRAVTSKLDGFQQAVREIIAEDSGFSTAREMSRTLLSVHRLWEFFRSKLAQRHEPELAGYLAIADEFAWLSYKPVYDKARQVNPNRALKEPPLVFLNGGLSPFILTRDAGFQAEAVPRELIQGSDLKQAMSSLPFPVIGVPWNQISHLPDALAVGHEIGHSVEADFDLEKVLDGWIDEAMVESGGQARAGLWKSWRSEVFADVYGCLAGGPAFVCALADFLLADPAEIGSRQPAMEPYPPENLRIRINACTLEKLGFPQPAARIVEDWNAQYPLPAGQSDFAAKDAPAVIGRFLENKMDALGGSLRSCFSFDGEQYSQAKIQAQCAIEQRALKNFEDLRVTLAAARIAYASAPKSYYSAGSPTAAKRLQDKMTSLLKNDLRSGEGVRTDKQQQQINDANRALGKQEFTALFPRTKDK